MHRKMIYIKREKGRLKGNPKHIGGSFCNMYKKREKLYKEEYKILKIYS